MFKHTHTSACLVFCSHLPRMTCSCAFAHSYRLSCCDTDQSGTLWTEPPWTCQMLHGRNRPTFPTAPLKGRGYGQVRTPTMLCLRAGKSRPDLKSTLNGYSYTSTQVRCPKTPSKETSHAAYKRTVSSISQSHLISWLLVVLVFTLTFVRESEIWIKRDLNMHCLILNSFVLLRQQVSLFPLKPWISFIIYTYFDLNLYKKISARLYLFSYLRHFRFL